MTPRRNTPLPNSAACVRAASCVNEWTGEKILNKDDVPEDLKFNHISIVGRYALNFHFSDGHDTGIFSFKYLQEITPNAEARGKSLCQNSAEKLFSEELGG